MRLIATLAALGLTALATVSPAEANGYGYSGSYGYRSPSFSYYQPYSYYQPAYYPSYGYSYAPSYNTYASPTYYYYPAMRWQGYNYPAGYYSKQYGVWYYKPDQYATAYPLGQIYSTASYTASTPAVSYTDSNWRTQLLGIAKARDAAELSIRKASVEQAAFLQGVQALGLTGNFSVQGYGQAVQYPQNYAAPAQNPYPNLQLGSYGASGNTIYGTTFNQIQQAYGTTDLNTLYQQASGHTKAALQLGGQASGEFNSLVGQAADNAVRINESQTRVAEALAKAEGVARMLRAFDTPSTTTRTSQSTFQVQSNGPPVTPQQGTPSAPPVPPTPGPDARAVPSSGTNGGARDAFANLIGTKCASCHSGDKKEGGLDLALWPTFDQERKDKIIKRLDSPDPEKRMPRTEKGPGEPLSVAEKRLFYLN